MKFQFNRFVIFERGFDTKRIVFPKYNYTDITYYKLILRTTVLSSSYFHRCEYPSRTRGQVFFLSKIDWANVFIRDHGRLG